MTNRKPNLPAALGRAKIEVVGTNDLGNMAHVEVCAAFLEAYGSSPTGFLYIEPTVHNSTKRPADLVLCHPDVGLLVIEVKAFSLDRIERIVAGTIHIRLGGRVSQKSPILQAKKAMFDIKNALEYIIDGTANHPLFGYIAAFPNISMEEWRTQYDNCLPIEQMLFAEHIQDPQLLKAHVRAYVEQSLSDTHRQRPLTENQLVNVRMAFGDSSVINSNRNQRPKSEVHEETLGSYIDELESLDKFLSEDQKDLGQLNVNGRPRIIRGVAGSGKTVVLAAMASRCFGRIQKRSINMFEEDQPKPRIAVLCFNRSLVKLLRDKIQKAYLQQTGEELSDEDILITHYNQLFWYLRDHIEYVRVQSEDDGERALHYLEQLEKLASEQPDKYWEISFDAIFVDEGQDFSPDDFRVLMSLIRANPATNQKGLVIFYDDAQNLYAQQRPNWSQIGIDVKNRSRVMKECFRNTREIVELAFNVLLGTAAPPEVRTKTRTYADVNYLSNANLIEETDNYVEIKFAKRTFDVPYVTAFNTRSQEKEWVASEIVRLVEDELVRPEDILVLFPKSGEYHDLTDLIRRTSRTSRISGFVQPYGKSADKDAFIFREGYLTLSTIHGAKGYDAPIVFLLGTDLLDLESKGRAAFFVGATRSKLMLNISGIEGPNTLLQEARDVQMVMQSKFEPVSASMAEIR